MKLLETTAGALKAALQSVARAVEINSTLPIVGMVKFEGATVEACNLDLSITTVWLDQGIDNGFCIEHRPLARLVERLPADTVVSVSIGKGLPLEVVFGSSVYEIASAPAADFPRVERLGRTAAVPIVAKSLRKALIFVRPFISTEETRYYLNGVCLDGGSAVATDWHRLGVHPLGFDASALNRGILPVAAVDTLIGLSKLSGMSIATPEKGCAVIVAVAGDTTVRARLIDATYPEWQRIVPVFGDGGKTITVNRAELLRAVHRIVSVVPGYLSHVYITGGDGRLTLMCHDKILDVVATETIPLLSGDTPPVCFKSLYLLDFLKQMHGDVVTATLDPDDAPRPSLWRVDDGDAYVALMPMKPSRDAVTRAIQARIRVVAAAGEGGAA